MKSKQRTDARGTDHLSRLRLGFRNIAEFNKKLNPGSVGQWTRCWCKNTGGLSSNPGPQTIFAHY